jgi:hypothetical protein
VCLAGKFLQSVYLHFRWITSKNTGGLFIVITWPMAYALPLECYYPRLLRILWSTANGYFLVAGCVEYQPHRQSGPIHHRRNGLFACCGIIFIVALLVGFSLQEKWVFMILLPVLCFFLFDDRCLRNKGYFYRRCRIDWSW